MNTMTAAAQKYLKEKGYRRFSLKAVLFDMDGVLYDSLPNHAASWTQVMRAYGIRMTEEDVYLHEGRTGDDTIDMISGREGKDIGAEEREELYREKTRLFSACPDVLPMRGSAELLRQVTGSGLFAMLVTGSGQPSLLESLNDDFPGIFIRERMVTSFDVKRGKPNPEPYLTALARGGLTPDEAIVVENAPLGVEAALAAVLFTVAVNTGPLPDCFLTDAGANVLRPSVETLSNEWNDLFDCLNTIRV